MKSSLFALALLASAPLLDAQEPALPETKIVLRVSRKFIQCLVGFQFEREVPIESNISGAAVVGNAAVIGKFRVALHESSTESDFDVLAQGEVTTQITATQRPVVVSAHGTAPFSARRHVGHKGESFVADPTEVNVHHHFTLDRICPFRKGLTGALTRRLARPTVRRSLVEGDRWAEEEIRTEVTEAMERELDKLVAALNQVQPLVSQAHELVIAELKLPPEGVRTYRAATKDHLLFSVGKADRRIPALPDLGKDKRAPVELWIAVSKNEAKEERRKALLQNWRLVVPLLRMQIDARSPELAKELDAPLTKLLDEVYVHQVPGWHIFAFAPKVLPAITIP